MLESPLKILGQIAPLVVSHIVIPASIILMVYSFLDYLLELRALFQMPGSLTLRWIALCFISATVLIERYGRMYGEYSRQFLYLCALAGVTVLAMSYFTRDVGALAGSGSAAATLSANLAIVAMIWGLASSLTRRLSLDERVPSSETKLYVPEHVRAELARLEVYGSEEENAAETSPKGKTPETSPKGKTPETSPKGKTAETSPKGKTAETSSKNMKKLPTLRPGDGPLKIILVSLDELIRSVPALDALRQRLLPVMRLLQRGRARLLGSSEADALGNPTRPVARVVLLAVLAFAIGEPMIMAADPEVGANALLSMIIFLFSAGLLFAAGSSVGTMRHAAARGSSVSLPLIPIRMGVAAGLLAVVLSAALAAPGVNFEGRGWIHPNRSLEMKEDGQPKKDSSSSNPEGPEEAAQKGEASSQLPPDDGAPAQGPPGAIGTLSSLAAIGGKFFLILAGLTLLVGVVLLLRVPGLWKSLMARVRAAMAELRNQLLQLLKDLNIRGLLGREKEVPRPDPMAEWDAIRGLPPKAAIRGAYGCFLQMAANNGRARAERLTPLEFLHTLPLPFRPHRNDIQALTELYVLAAYSDRELEPAEKTKAIGIIEALNRMVKPAPSARQGGARKAKGVKFPKN